MRLAHRQKGGKVERRDMRKGQQVGDRLHKLGEHVRGSTANGVSQRWVDFVATAAAVGIPCFLAERVALALISETEGVAVFWPASGVAVGILIARGRNGRLPVTIGVIVATLAANLMSDRSLWASIAKSGCAA